jgi:hypothetical protein
MANKVSSSAFKVLMVDGISMLGAKVKSFSDKVTNILQANTHGLGDSWGESSATGLQKAAVAQKGAFFETATGSIHDAFAAVGQQVRILVYAFTGNIAGKMFVGAKGTYLGSYAAAPQVAVMVAADATYEVTGQVDRGLIVQPWLAKTADWNTGNELSLAITRSSTTATATTTPAHGYAIGSVVIVTVAGADQT